jgi:hypothetical protein
LTDIANELRDNGALGEGECFIDATQLALRVLTSSEVLQFY